MLEHDDLPKQTLAWSFCGPEHPGHPVPIPISPPVPAVTAPSESTLLLLHTQCEVPHPLLT